MDPKSGKLSTIFKNLALASADVKYTFLPPFPSPPTTLPPAPLPLPPSARSKFDMNLLVNEIQVDNLELVAKERGTNLATTEGLTRRSTPTPLVSNTSSTPSVSNTSSTPSVTNSTSTEEAAATPFISFLLDSEEVVVVVFVVVIAVVTPWTVVLGQEYPSISDMAVNCEYSSSDSEVGEWEDDAGNHVKMKES